MPRKNFGRIFTDEAFMDGKPFLKRPYGYGATSGIVYADELEDLIRIGFNARALAQATAHMQVEERLRADDMLFDPNLPREEFVRYTRQLMASQQENREIAYLGVNEIIDLIEKGGYRDSDVLSAFPHLEAPDLSACRAFAAVNMPGSREYRRNNRYSSVKILLDENLPHDLVLPLSHHTSNLSHIYYEGMGGYMDEFIYWRPKYQIKERGGESDRQRSKRLGIKHIIISNDSDLCDLAEDQWRQRIGASSNPDAIDFKDTNTVFSIAKHHYTKLKDPEFCEQVARGIMRAAFDPKAPWYKIRGNGTVYPGVLFSSLCQQVEDRARRHRFIHGLATEAEAEEGRQNRALRRLQQLQAYQALGEHRLDSLQEQRFNDPEGNHPSLLPS